MKWFKKSGTVVRSNEVVTGVDLEPRLSKWQRLVRHKKLIAVVAAIVVLGAAGGAYYWYANRDTEGPIPVKDLQQEIARTANIPLSPNASEQEKADRANTMGVLYLTAGQPEEALPYLLQAEEVYSSASQKYGLWLDIASAYEQVGNNKQAVNYYKKVLNAAQHPSGGERNQKAIDEFTQKIDELGG